MWFVESIDGQSSASKPLVEEEVLLDELEEEEEEDLCKHVILESALYASYRHVGFD